MRQSCQSKIFAVPVYIHWKHLKRTEETGSHQLLYRTEAGKLSYRSKRITENKNLIVVLTFLFSLSVLPSFSTSSLSESKIWLLHWKEKKVYHAVNFSLYKAFEHSIRHESSYKSWFTTVQKMLKCQVNSEFSGTKKFNVKRANVY